MVQKSVPPDWSSPNLSVSVRAKLMREKTWRLILQQFSQFSVKWKENINIAILSRKASYLRSISHSLDSQLLSLYHIIIIILIISRDDHSSDFCCHSWPWDTFLLLTINWALAASQATQAAIAGSQYRPLIGHWAENWPLIGQKVSSSRPLPVTIKPQRKRSQSFSSHF